jgi:HTH-type transcriptional regulator, sugar sensing transcriptional regulator
MDQLILQLKQLGYTEYEAKAYIALVQNSHVSAYQVSKDSGIPRARIYGTLDLLVKKGLVLKESSTNQTIYSALPVSMFLAKSKEEWHKNFDSMSEEFKKIEVNEPKEENKILVIKSRESIIEYCKKVISEAKNKIVLSMWDDMYEEFQEILEEKSKAVSIRGITLHVENALPTLDKHRITNYTETITNPHWFIISVDGHSMIYGPSPQEREVAFYTNDPVHIYLLEDYIWHDVLVNRLVKRTDLDLNEWITKERTEFFN